MHRRKALRVPPYKAFTNGCIQTRSSGPEILWQTSLSDYRSTESEIHPRYCWVTLVSLITS